MHVALIPDGNRRWARKHNLSLEEAYKKGIEHFGDFLKWSHEFGVNEVTVWAMSYDNYVKRSKEEISTLLKLFKYFYDYVSKKKDELYQQYPVLKSTQIRFIGKWDLLPWEYQEIIKYVHRETHGDFKINFLLIYSGRIEILEAAKKLPENATEQDLIDNLMLKDFPDLVIRTGGHIRTSGFLPIQSEYSEWYFVEELWPDFSKEKYMEILEDFKKRERKFGK